MRNILITGCSKGIGFEIVKTFAKNSSINIIGVARNDIGLAKLNQECKEINNNFNLKTISIDVSNIDAIDKIVELIKVHFNATLDGLIHNAGTLVNKPFTEITNQELEDSFRVNCFSPFILTQKLFPYFSTSAHILSISSMGGVQGTQKFPGLSAYSTSKATLITFTECLAEEFKMTDLSFNCLALGAVKTEMLSKAFPGYNPPLSAKEMGDFIADFLLTGHKYFNGKVIPVSLTTP